MGSQGVKAAQWEQPPPFFANSSTQQQAITFQNSINSNKMQRMAMHYFIAAPRAAVRLTSSSARSLACLLTWPAAGSGAPRFQRR